MSRTPQELFQERDQRVNDAIALRKPDRIPVIPLFGAFASVYAGISRKDELYDLAADPGETKNVYRDHPDMVARLTRLFEQLRDAKRSRP